MAQVLRTGKGGDADRASDLLGELRRYARDGTISVWGQPYSAASGFDQCGVLRPIEKEYWDEHTFYEPGCLMGERLDDVRTRHDGYVREAGLGLYCGLMVSRREIEAIWPQRRKRLQLRRPWQID
jgi:hypothetical protein